MWTPNILIHCFLFHGAFFLFVGVINEMSNLANQILRDAQMQQSGRDGRTIVDNVSLSVQNTLVTQKKLGAGVNNNHTSGSAALTMNLVNQHSPSGLFRDSRNPVQFALMSVNKSKPINPKTQGGFSVAPGRS
jgi:hypothetical protein